MTETRETEPTVYDVAQDERDGFVIQRERLYRDGVRVLVFPFEGTSWLALSVRKDREIGSDCWRPADFSISCSRFETVKQVDAYGRALVVLAAIGAELDAEFPPPE